MSLKRQATTDLNHTNWDKDNPEDHEEMGVFKPVPKEELEKRVIRTAKRRSHNPVGTDAKKAVFSSFGGFNKAPTSSFDFLANLTNGNKSNGNEAQKSENAAPSGLFGSKPLASSTFQMPTSSPSTLTSASFGTTSQPASVFGGSPNNSLFSANTNTTAADSPFKSTTASATTAPATPTGFTFKASTSTSKTATPQVSPSLFSAQPASSIPITLFSSSTANDNKETNSTTAIENSIAFPHQKTSDATENKSESKTDDASNNPDKFKFYSKLKGLNESVLDWIKKHVNETPLCILTPIFNDYEKYLKEIQEEYEKSKELKKKETSQPSLFTVKDATPNTGSLFSAFKANATSASENKPLPAFSVGSSSATTASTSTAPGFTFGINNATENSPFGAKPAETSSPFAMKLTESASPFGAKPVESNSPFGAKPAESISPFGAKPAESNSPFGAKPAESNSPFGAKPAESNSPFGAKPAESISPFGAKPAESNSPFGAKPAESISPFGAKPAEGNPLFGGKTMATSTAPFSFGIGQPFSFSPNTQNPIKTATDADKDEKEEDDEPPKVEYNPVAEENSVFDKKCKIFVKKEDSYADKGVGTLYLKKLESGKHQLLVRANTSLGNVLMNFILSVDIPTQRLGKNNVMVVCVPTPDAAPPPVPVLIRVKTPEEADELLEVLNKHKA